MPDETVDTENIDPQQEVSPPENNLRNLTKLKGVSWQDGVDGKSLFTVREFEPSETAYTEDEDDLWGKKKGCCVVM